MSTRCELADVDQDRHGARLVAEFEAGRLTAAQVVQLALATGRLQGHYSSAAYLAAEAGIVREFNSIRNTPAVMFTGTAIVSPAPRAGCRWFRRLVIRFFYGR